MEEPVDGGLPGEWMLEDMAATSMEPAAGNDGM
jgi:hypothetical protein